MVPELLDDDDMADDELLDATLGGAADKRDTKLLDAKMADGELLDTELGGIGAETAESVLTSQTPSCWMLCRQLLSLHQRQSFGASMPSFHQHLLKQSCLDFFCLFGSNSLVAR